MEVLTPTRWKTAKIHPIKHSLVSVLQSVFSLQPPGRFLLPLTTLDRYQPRDSGGKFFLTTTCIFCHINM